MKPDDLQAIKRGRKARRKKPERHFFVASKVGGNAKGRGAERSVILVGNNNTGWHQWHKVWGDNDRDRALEIVKQIYDPKQPTQQDT